MFGRAAGQARAPVEDPVKQIECLISLEVLLLVYGTRRRAIKPGQRFAIWTEV